MPVVTVSTVKDTLEGFQRFVTRNLNSGVDHLVVFVEDGAPEALAWLADQPQVTTVHATDAWWGRGRPSALNARQKVNANLARAVLATETGRVPDLWLFHHDGDEVLRPSHDGLHRVPATVAVVHAPPQEAVSRQSWPGQRVTRFKRLLGEDELELVRLLGLIDRPLNEDYFHGHVRGKAGMRPALDRWFALHDVLDRDDVVMAPFDIGSGPPLATVLHYESWSGDEFVRKWTNILASGQLPALRNKRQATAAAVRALAGLNLPDDVRADVLGRIYRRTTEDDLDTLGRLGLLVDADPDAAQHVPQGFDERARARLAVLLNAFAGVDKRPLKSGETEAKARDTLRQVVRRLPDHGLGREDADRVAAVWSGAEVSSSARTRGRPWRRDGTSR